MLELQGKFGVAKVFTDVVDNESISQVINLLNQPYIEGSKVRMMPDIHAGAGCTIGTTMTIKDKICPNLVGVDIGCGMETIRIKETHIEPQKLDKVIRAGVPSGFEIRTEAHRYASSLALATVSIASGVGCCLAVALSNKFSKDKTYVNVIMSDNLEAMQEFRDFLATHHITNVAADSYTLDWSKKSITITAYAETKAQSKLIDDYIANSSLKFKRVISRS